MMCADRSHRSVTLADHTRRTGRSRRSIAWSRRAGRLHRAALKHSAPRPGTIWSVGAAIGWLWARAHRLQDTPADRAAGITPSASDAQSVGRGHDPDGSKEWLGRSGSKARLGRSGSKARLEGLVLGSGGETGTAA